jgi:hypothetical protein
MRKKAVGSQNEWGAILVVLHFHHRHKLMSGNQCS